MGNKIKESKRLPVCSSCVVLWFIRYQVFQINRIPISTKALNYTHVVIITTLYEFLISIRIKFYKPKFFFLYFSYIQKTGKGTILYFTNKSWLCPNFETSAMILNAFFLNGIHLEQCPSCPIILVEYHKVLWIRQ